MSVFKLRGKHLFNPVNNDLYSFKQATLTNENLNNSKHMLLKILADDR